MKNIFMGVLAAVIAAAGAYLRELIVPVIVLLCVMLADYITGMARAWITKTLSSRVGVKGIVKKLAYMFAVAVGIVVDWIIQSAAGKVGVDLGGFYFVGLLVTVWLILNELISILENVAEIGAPVPAFLLKLIQRLKKSAEEKGDEAAGYGAEASDGNAEERALLDKLNEAYGLRYDGRAGDRRE